METHELLDRYELLYPKNTYISDLRRAYIDKDISSIFRLLPDTVNGTKDDLRKAVLENNLHSIFRLCENDNLRKLVKAEIANCSKEKLDKFMNIPTQNRNIEKFRFINYRRYIFIAYCINHEC